VRLYERLIATDRPALFGKTLIAAE
jgi:hypothetical protein